MEDFRKGYFLSKKDMEKIVGDAALDYKEQKERLSILRLEAYNFAEKLLKISDDLKHDSARIKDSDIIGLPEYDEISVLVEDIKETEAEVLRLDKFLKELSFNN